MRLGDLRPLVVTLVMAMTLLNGCDDEASDDPGGAGGEGGAPMGGVGGEGGAGGAPVGGEGGSAQQQAPDMPAVGEWAVVEPGGETICSRGTPFHFFVRGGDPNKLVIDFQGGGACWDELTCSVAGALFNERVQPLDALEALLEQGKIGGLFDPDPSNPFHDWTIIHIPYCTGDIHWGDAVKEYDEETTINHKGFVNARAAVEWVQDRVTEPGKVMVSGCSAGAYGAIMHSAYIANHYQASDVAVFADAGGGIITDTFLQDSLPNWGAEPNLPPFVEGLQMPIDQLSIEDVYTSIAETFPQHRFSQYSAAYDDNQIFFFRAMGGEAEAWPGLYRQSLESIAEAAPNFRYYLAEGAVHCVLPYPFMHDRATNGINLTDWLSQLAEGDTTPETVACEGADCLSDPICDACLEDDDTLWCNFCANWPGMWEAE